MIQSYVIYQITNLINNKIYIGKHKTYNINDDYMGSGKLLLAAQKKYGIENFRKEILFVFSSEEEMNAKEKQLVTEDFCKRIDTYNLCIGGQGGFSYINEHKLYGFSDKNVAKLGRTITDSKLEYLYGAEWRQVLGNKGQQVLSEILKSNPNYLKDKNARGFLGRKHSEETKTKMRKSKNVGKNNPNFGTMWITDGAKNVKIKRDEVIPNNWRKGRTINTDTSFED